MSEPPTQIEIEQAPAKKLLADIRVRKVAETLASAGHLAADYPLRERAARRRDARAVLAAVMDGRVPNVTFNG
jgi:hypothetical protein